MTLVSTGLQLSLIVSLNQLTIVNLSCLLTLSTRHQFPPTPSRNSNVGSVGIPQWQRTLAQTTPTKSEQNRHTSPSLHESSSNGSSPGTYTSEPKTQNGMVEELVTLPVAGGGAVKETLGENSD